MYTQKSLPACILRNLTRDSLYDLTTRLLKTIETDLQRISITLSG